MDSSLEARASRSVSEEENTPSTPGVKKNFGSRYRPSVQVSRRRFEELVADALDDIPPELAAEMDNVAVVVEDWPRPDQLPDGAQLLGLYEGTPLPSRSFMAPGAMPDRITIFRGPLCERARDEDDLAAQVRVTVLHEVGHHFGISDQRLREIGWA